MNKLAITTVLALGIAAPAIAQSQLEQSLGAEAGQYTLNELALLKAVSTEEGNDGRVYLGNRKIVFSADNIHNATAARIFDELAEAARSDED